MARRKSKRTLLNIEKTTKIDSMKIISFSKNIGRVNPWSAETPELYQLELSLFDNQRNLIQTIIQDIRFRRVEIKNRKLHINGKEILIKGVNRHEWDPIH